LADEDGSFPALLLMLTVVTGLVDAVSFLKLGHVFVANMTGNVVFLGFSAAGGSQVDALSVMTAIAAFLIGAFVGGGIALRAGGHRGRLLAFATGIKVSLVIVAMITAYAVSVTIGVGRYTVIALLALAMGIQNATARKLNVRDVTTTVLTMTLTGLAADLWRPGGTMPPPTRRLLSVLAMLTGAFLGGLLVLKQSTAAALALAAILLATASVLAFRAPAKTGGT
jgi:uncharacterized membrane protein YoaK (UPF0700 family)